MSKRIQRLQEQVASIDKAIDELRGANYGTPNHSKMMELQKMAGKKEKEIARLQHLAELPERTLYDLTKVLYKVKQRIEEYPELKDEISEVVELVEAKLQEYDDETNRRGI